MPSRYAAAHANPQGPGDARLTALQIIQDNNLSNTLNGKVALVTGISSGIGLETALALRAAGMHVFGAVRNISKTTAALGHHLSPGALELIELDMNSLSSVRACAASFLERSSSLHVLVTNAGIMMTPQASTQDGHEIQFGTNHLAHFLLFQLLKPTLLASATPEYASRVIALSSVGHRSHTLDFTNLASLDANGNYDTVAAYARSKLAAIYMANEIERRYGDRHLHAFSVMPGGIWSGLQASLPGAVVDAWKGDAEFQKAWKSAEQGAATTVWGAVAPELEGLGGKYLEDCDVAEQARDESNMGCPGFAGHAFDREAEQQLWRVSCELVGAGDED